MTDTTLLLEPNVVLLDPDNPPSRTRDTTDLQTAMLAVGRQIHRIVVREIEGGKYQVISGNRRTVACRALGWQVRAVLVDDATKDELDMMSVASNVQRELSPLEKAHELHRLIKATGSTLNVAKRSFGLGTNEARLLAELVKAPAEIQQKVDRGKMSLSAFGEWLKAPPEVKQELKDKEGDVTARDVQQERRKARVEKAERMLEDEAHLVELVQVAQKNLVVLRGAAPFKNGVIGSIRQGLKEIGRLVEEVQELVA